MTELYNYSAGQVVGEFAGILLEGAGEDDFISIVQDQETFTLKGSADGRTASRARNEFISHTVSLTLLASSPTNARLSAIHNLDRATPNGAGVGTFQVRDHQGTTIHRTDQCWIQQPPEETFGREAPQRVWTLRCIGLQTTYGAGL
jgi:hypothetical protein